MLKLYLPVQKWSEQAIGNFWPSLVSPKYLNPEHQTGTLCHKMKPPYITMYLLNWKIIFKILSVCYLKMQNENLLLLTIAIGIDSLKWYNLEQFWVKLT